MSGPGNVPPASVVLQNCQSHHTSGEERSNDRLNPSGAMILLTILRCPTGPITFEAGDGWDDDDMRQAMDPA